MIPAILAFRAIVVIAGIPRAIRRHIVEVTISAYGMTCLGPNGLITSLDNELPKANASL